jgi:polyphosphate kinase 2 (PPK2 family)
MLEKINLDLEMSKKEYKQRMNLLAPRLTLMQRACWENGLPVTIIFEGWDAGGKGTSINHLVQYMDPRGFRIHPIKGATELEASMPWLWRFWRRLPNHGEIAIFDRSWYGRVLVERVERLVPAAVWKSAYQDIVDFERTLVDDGMTIIKFLLHISKDEQKKRFKRLEKDPLQSWRVEKEDWKHHEKYNDYLAAIEEMLERTETEWGSWTIVEATDRNWAQHKIIETVCRRMEETLTARGKTIPILEKEADLTSVEGEG